MRIFIIMNQEVFMKKITTIIVTAFVLFCFTGCSGQQSSGTNMSPGEIAAAIQSSQKELPELLQITPEDADFDTWLSDYYFLQAEQVTDGVICYAEGVEASEIAVLILKEEKDCKAAGEALKEYIGNRAGVFEGYAPQQAAMAKNGIVVENAAYIVLLICPEPQAAREAFLGCFGKGAENKISADSSNNAGDAGSKTNSGEDAAAVSSLGTEDPAGTAGAEVSVGMENSYNAEAVLQAYLSGDASSLSELNRSILEATQDVLATEINEGMSDYEKELAVHDWITEHSGFSMSAFSRGPSGVQNDSDTPYGVLIESYGNCWSYSSTFQLFMDMLDIECLTVFGIPNSSGVAHSWNMVNLDGDWYCVDCAWDDPIGGRPCHTYFNVTSDYLRSGSIHRWDEETVPEATGTAYSYGSH